MNESSLQLGEDARSYGYGGTGKASRNSQFRDYGSKYGVGDVVGCYLDMSAEPITVSYTLNGRDLGVAFRIPAKELDGRALYPHILTKNQNFMVNFGQLPAPLMTLKPNFMPIGQLDVTDGLIRGSQPPAERADCEVSFINLKFKISLI